MKTYFMWFLALITTAAISTNTANADSAVEMAVHRLGPDTKMEDLAALRADPALAVTLLVEQIKSIPENKILKDEQKAKSEEMHIIWSIRALRYLTGLDFIGKTTHQFKDNDEEDRSQFLHLTKNSEVTFFGVWMSRDSIYVAPSDAQREIAKKWKQWAESEAKGYKFKAPKGFDEWYF